MAKQQTIEDQANTPVQGAGSAAEQEQASVLLEAQTPEWVQAILDSNAAVLESNQQVVDSLNELKDLAKEAGAYRGEAKAVAGSPKSAQVDPDADYVVTRGNSFADRDDITKRYSEGEDVTHLGAERLQSLLDQGLIEEA